MASTSREAMRGGASKIKKIAGEQHRHEHQDACRAQVAANPVPATRRSFLLTSLTTTMPLASHGPIVGRLIGSSVSPRFALEER
jgi:hypothetical protein